MSDVLPPCLAAALEYESLGWSVLQCCPPDHIGVGKQHGSHCQSKGKAPFGPWKEFQDRRATPQELRDKWRYLPNGNVGLALGPVSGLVRIDVDGPAGETRLAELSQGDLPDTLEFTSGRENAGRGLLYAIPPDVILRTTHESGGIKEELRLQAKGAQTVLPPSRHASGSVYAWKPGHGPSEIRASPAPSWLIRELSAPVSRPQRPPVAPAIAEDGTPTAAAEYGFEPGDQHRDGLNGQPRSDRFKLYEQDRVGQGERDDTLYKEACGLWQEQARLGGQRVFTDGLTETMVLRRLIGLNACFCDPPLTEDEVRAKVQSAKTFISQQNDNQRTYKALNSLGLEYREGEWWPGEWKLTRIIETEPIFRVATPLFTVDLLADVYDKPQGISVEVMRHTGVCLFDRPGEWPAIWNGWIDKKAKIAHRGLKAKLLDTHTVQEGAPDVRREVVILEWLADYLRPCQRKPLEPGALPSGESPKLHADGSYTFPFSGFFGRLNVGAESYTRSEVNRVLESVGITEKQFRTDRGLPKRLRIVLPSAYRRIDPC